MRLLKSFLIILFVSLIGFFSCKKSNSNPSVNSSITFKFNDTTKNADLIASSYSTSNDTLQISGAVGLYGTIAIAVKNPQVGTFSIASGGLKLSYIPTSLDLNQTYVASAGTLTITQFSSASVAGTFSFTGVNKKEMPGVFTDGSFQTLLPK